MILPQGPTAALAMLASAAVGLGAGLAASALSGRPSKGDILGSYGRWWGAQCDFLRLSGAVRRAVLAPPLLAAASGLAFARSLPLLGVCCACAAALPPMALKRLASRRRLELASQLDGTVTALANALGVTPNLGDALRSLVSFTEPPMRDEIRDTLAEVDLGRPIDDALTALSERLGVPGFDVAIAAAITGRRSGGNLGDILKRTAHSLREMARLEGVIHTKTAEGRSQAIVMGLIPPGLVAVLDKIDPTWLEPMWNDPIGWGLLGAAAILEIAAIALIRKIMAVDI